ncbi:MAG: amidohydrolase family protein [Clostridia bacterium]|nr:amidohydrolase family protein [Clostridia bacterium]
MKTVKKIDIHVHTTEATWLSRLPSARYATPTELMDMYDQIGVEKGVILPNITVETDFHISSNYEIKNIVDKYPDRFAWFCNLDARQGSNSPDTDFTPYLQVCKENGAKGVGEVCTNLYFDDPLMLNLFRHCEKNDMPLIFHIGRMGGDYGIVDDPGLPHLEKALQACPDLLFLGHSQKFWAEISGDLDPSQRGGYPQGKVFPGGRVVEMMRKYPNLCGDLSAGSGYNAVSRDPEFGYAFMEEFQDRLYYGTDICDPNNITNPMLKLAAFLDEGMLSGRLSYDAYYKISRGNAEKLLAK